MNQLDMYAETLIRHQQAATAARIERRQLLHEAFAGRRGRVAFYRPLLVSVGRQMVAWGMRLQSHDDQPTPDRTWAIQNR
jgi:hypothetical protein